MTKREANSKLERDIKRFLKGIGRETKPILMVMIDGVIIRLKRRRRKKKA